MTVERGRKAPLLKFRATAALLEQVCDLDLSVLEAVELPRGFGRDGTGRRPAPASGWRHESKPGVGIWRPLMPQGRAPEPPRGCTASSSGGRDGVAAGRGACQTRCARPPRCYGPVG